MPSRPCEEGGGDTSSGGAAAAAGLRTSGHYGPIHQVPAPAPGVCASSQAGGADAPTSTELAETSGTGYATGCEAPQAEAPVLVGVPLSACSQALRRSPRLQKRPQPQTEQTQTQPPTQTEQPQPQPIPNLENTVTPRPVCRVSLAAADVLGCFAPCGRPSWPAPRWPSLERRPCTSHKARLLMGETARVL